MSQEWLTAMLGDLRRMGEGGAEFRLSRADAAALAQELERLRVRDELAEGLEPAALLLAEGMDHLLGCMLLRSWTAGGKPGGQTFTREEMHAAIASVRATLTPPQTEETS